jgi:excinuclease ABC subunit A
MPASDIVIKGAREHNLCDVDLVLPRNKLICLTGVSGSGKSSLAFDTLYAEGQRRYVESLSSFARQFLGQMPKPDVDLLAGLSPSISISQKSAGYNPRSTVGTITEIYDYLRVLFARVGQGHCPDCGKPITAQTREQILQRILDLPEGTRISVLAPMIRGQKGEYRDLFEDLLKQGFIRARVDGQVVPLTDNLQLDRQMRHDIEVVVDRIAVRPAARARLAEAVDLALKIGKGNLIVSTEAADADQQAVSSEPAKAARRGKRRKTRRTGRPGDLLLSVDYACTECGVSFEPPSPQMFSFNSPHGMCSECDGLGELYTFDPELLVPDPRLSFKKGCFEILGRWQEMGRWKRHIYQGVADSMEKKLGADAGTMLDTPWQDLPQQLADLWLWGTGDEHITFTWRGGNSPMKYGGTYEGLIPQLLSKYRNTKSRMQLRQLERYMNTVECPRCHGQRLNRQARSVKISTGHPRFAGNGNGRTRKRNTDAARSRTHGGNATGTASMSLPEVCDLSVVAAADFFEQLVLDHTRQVIAAEAIKEIRGRLGFLKNVGLDYLTLSRTAPTLSGGESQRIRLAGQIGCGLVGVLYILDEPSIGLHARDNDRLLDTLCRLRDMGNTVVVVEHDEETMRSADHIVDFGPGPGVRGGQLVAAGPPDTIIQEPRSVTGQYLSGTREINMPAKRRPAGDKWLRVVGARHNNLKTIDAEIPLGMFVCVTGVSGSGKSSLVNDILVEALRRDLNRGDGHPGAHQQIEGLEHLDKLIAIDQSPIGRTPRSNPGTYIKVFDDIRNLFAQLPDSKRRGYKPGRFSFNVDGGRCSACDGNGANKLEMDFLADIWVTCPVCEGHRYNRETLQVRFKGKSIAEVLEMDVQQALDLFENQPKIRHKLQTLHDVGLDYLKLGQPSPTLSGGEAQRIKLARELVKKSTGQTLYLLDEPTTGLHFADIEMLLKVLHDFADAGNTVLVVEHNLDIIKTADWIIDLGPEGGEEGGRIVATGTPEDVAGHPESHTGLALAPLLLGKHESRRTKSKRATRQTAGANGRGRLARKITVQGARQHNLKDIDVDISRDRTTVVCGMSGSGKTSLAMDTIYAEGQRRYVESLSAYARQFVSQMQKPRVDHVEGLSPAIAIEQKNLGHTPRSTVGTVTEIYDYLRVLYARLGTPYCPDCDEPIGTQTSDEIVDKILSEPDGTRAFLMAPVEIDVGQRYETLWDEIRAAGYVRIRVDRQTHSLDNPPLIDRRRRHQVEVVIDRVTVRRRARSRIADSVENALAFGRGVLHVACVREELPEPKWPVVVHSQHLACDRCGRSFEPLSPHNFSFNSSLGWCSACEGLGTQVGANPAALIRDPKLSLKDGALLIWPNVEKAISQAMLAALTRDAGIPTDVPLAQLSPRQRRMIMHGTGETWFSVLPPGDRQKEARPLFRFQYKGLYPALEEASRLSPSFRARLEHLVDEVECTTCAGTRLRDDAAAVQFRRHAIDELSRLPMGQLKAEVDRWRMSARERRIAGELIREIKSRVTFLNDVGLEYLTLARSAPTLSAGEAQRIRLASQLGSGLCGVLYVLDEPTIGLHPRDNRRLIRALGKLRDLGNTLLIVEHDREVIESADAVLDFGPGAGQQGGHIVAQGTPAQISRRRNSVTGPYLNGKKAIPIPSNRRIGSGEAGMRNAERGMRNLEDKGARSSGDARKAKSGKSTKRKGDANLRTASAAPVPHSEFRIPHLEIVGARHNNLKNIDVRIPLGTLTAVTGPSGSGKSSLVEDILCTALARRLHRAYDVPGAHDEIRGVEHINKVIRVDQQPLGNSPTSNAATYTGVFELIRALYAQLPESKLRGYTARRFSFNVPGGRCEDCEGAGQRCIEMHFLPDVWVTCETCDGHRYNPETLAVRYHGQSVADVLEMSCGRALKLFENIPKIRRVLQTLCDVGLDYLTLGQAAPTLSGGEAQRVKLAAELSRPDTGRTLYLLDEPTTGLHFEDLAKLLSVLNRLVDLGNTVVVIEHNLDVIKSADWVIDLGPEAGDGGGRVVAAGTPEYLAAYARQRKRRKRGQDSFVQSTGTDRRLVRAGSRQMSPDPFFSLRSHTGEALIDALAAGPYEKRPLYDPTAAEERRAGDMDILQIGRSTKMPWEIDGRAWHTADRVDRRGEPCRWDGEILARVVDRIHELGEFSDTDWNSRSVVEISAPKKSDGWFFHAITAETWLLKMKFRVAKNTFRRDDLVARLELKTLNQLEDVPVYGNEPRVKCRNLRGPWQEVEVRAFTLEEIDKPEFWSFVERAVNGFFRHTQRAAAKPEDIMPWKKLGQKWHLSRRGFPPGKPAMWEAEVLEELCEMLREIAPDGQFLWHNQVLVNLMVKQQRDPWATITTKAPQWVRLDLRSPKGRIGFGRVTDLGCDRNFDTARPEYDLLQLMFRTVEDLHQGDLAEFLKEHLATFQQEK